MIEPFSKLTDTFPADPPSPPSPPIPTATAPLAIGFTLMEPDTAEPPLPPPPPMD